MLNDIQKHILEVVSGMAAGAQGAVNIRANGKRAYHSNCEGVRIEPKTDKEGIDIIIEPGVKADHVYIPVVVTEGGRKDVVYNDFYIGEGADVTIMAMIPEEKADAFSARIFDMTGGTVETIPLGEAFRPVRIR